MKKYWKIWWRVVRMSIQRDLMYKWDFVVGNSGAVVYIIVQLAMIAILFYSGNVTQIAGFSRYDIYFVLLLSEMVLFVQSVFGTNNFRLVREQIHQGRLDMLLIKPVNTLFLSMFQSIGIKEGLVIFFYSIFLLPYVLNRISLDLDLISCLQIVWIMMISAVLMMALYWITIYICFFADNFFGLWWFMNNTLDINHYPRDLYPRYFQIFLLYFFPIFMIGNPIYLVLEKRFTWQANLEMVLVAVVFCEIAGLMWYEGVKRYQSAA